MRPIGFIMEDGFQIMGVAASTAFEFANIQLGEQAYRVTIMSEKGGPVRSTLGVHVETAPLGDFPDTLMVVGELLPKPTSPGLRAYIAEAGQKSRRVAGVCTGAFLLADAGLLDGRSATTHWAHAAELQQRFPSIRVDDDRIFVADGNIWTSAGMTAGIDLVLALIEDDHGAEVSRAVARRLVVYHRRPGGQSQFSALLELEPRSDRVRRALTYAKEHLRNPLSVDELADAASLSPRQFSRIFREETGQSPAKAVERLRLEAAKAMLEDGRHSLDIVARDTGFADRDRMRRAFLRFFGQPPQSLRRSLRLIEGEPDEAAE
ncbi:putative bifunctional protein: class I glutamine amidotransferase-like (N-terminal), transcriptional regulator protein AraC/XylS family (C-terminal) [Bradyrhizobium sp. ORS 375]|uniref:GlxA family transcriptional regulator n=1 Tax=Bradyrhizobium sp. (strain ORS 375) TaxID=566679 RepID=UPI0002406F62|nr:GlxA family transcriptional regulator [Bradyrhizobium sp. ORS 375]CCD95116.1 putative bifunctional protein: class I glutamine amidotransferase-like (N-terminal), transcriptional regulator protein AraC/XylS family (C-terminal) [Bradyrhizobium sp. ORS 375]